MLTFLSGFSFFITLVIVLSRTPDCAAVKKQTNKQNFFLKEREIINYCGELAMAAHQVIIFY